MFAHAPVDPEARAIEKITAAKALAVLRPRERRVIEMIVFDEMTLKEVGAVLNVCGPRVATLRDEALRRIRRALNVTGDRSVTVRSDRDRARIERKQEERLAVAAGLAGIKLSAPVGAYMFAPHPRGISLTLIGGWELADDAPPSGRANS